MQNTNYSYLREVFNDFICTKSGKLKAVEKTFERLKQYGGLKEDGRHTIYEGLGLTAKEVYDTYIAPWEKLTTQQALQVSLLWNLQFGTLNDLFMDTAIVFDFNTLHWTCVNVYATKLFNFFRDDYKEELAAKRDPEEMDLITEFFVASQYSLPYQQCFYCGQLDKDNRGKAFTSKKEFVFCHLNDCHTQDPNPSAHPEGCCYAAWKRIKNALLIRCKRHKAYSEEVIDIFKEFCLERYQKNLETQTPVRAREQKPREWQTVYDLALIKSNH